MRHARISSASSVAAGPTPSIPYNSTFIPKDKTAIPKDKTLIPKDKTTILKNKTLIPKHKTVIPKDKPLIPKNIPALPTNKRHGAACPPKIIFKEDFFMSSYIPTKEAEFVDWSANLIAVSKENISEWNLPEVQVTDLETQHDEFKTLHEKCQTASYTKLDMQAKNEKLAALKKAEEIFVRNNLQNNDAMTDNGREALRIPIYDRTPTPHPAPSTVPDVEVATPLPRTLHIKFRADNAARWGKPEYVHGLECLWVIADAPPAKIEELLHSEFATRSPLNLTFDEDQRGKRLYFATRWESGAVKKGPWSEIFNAIIP